MVTFEEIIAFKKRMVASLKKIRGEHFYENLCSISDKDFLNAIAKPLSLIAEIKHASPTAGKLMEKFSHLELAKIYEESGASAISVVTDELYFKGNVIDIFEIRSSKLPILRKDFIIDRFQVYESRAYGADAILLIAKILTDDQIKEFTEIAETFNMDVVLEVHSEEELFRAINLKAKVIGINNRDLKTFKVNINTTFDLVSKIQNKTDFVIISESGISTKEDIDRLKEAGVNAVLIGTSILESENPAQKIKDLGF